MKVNYEYHHNSPQVKPQAMLWPGDPELQDNENLFWIKLEGSDCLHAAVRNELIENGEPQNGLNHTVVTIRPRINND